MNFHRSVLCRQPGCNKEVDVCCGLDLATGQVAMTVTCEMGHVQKLSWQPGQMPDPGQMPFIPGIVERG